MFVDVDALHEHAERHIRNNASVCVELLIMIKPSEIYSKAQTLQHEIVINIGLSHTIIVMKVRCWDLSPIAAGVPSKSNMPFN